LNMRIFGNSRKNIADILFFKYIIRTPCCNPFYVFILNVQDRN